MDFFKYLYKDKRDNILFIILTVLSLIFYITSAIKIVIFISNLGSVVNPFNTDMFIVNPFNTDMFKVNLFNFDPTVYYTEESSTIIHPFYSFITNTIGATAKAFGGNITILFINSLINALGVGLTYLFFRIVNLDRKLAFVLSSIYCVISYNMVIAFVPDSYVYAQLGIIISVLYILYGRKNGYGVLGIAITVLLNFGITLTNIIPYVLAILVSKSSEKWRDFIRKIIIAIGIFISIGTILTLIQYLFFEENWIISLTNSIKNRGMIYSMPFNVNKHSAIFRFMFVSPILMPTVKLINGNLMAVVTDLSSKLNIIKIVIISILIILIIYSIIIKRKSPIMRVLLCYIIWNVFLHVVIGYGLVTFEYDMYLYAGHYMSILFMVMGFGLIYIKSRGMKATVLAIAIAIGIFIYVLINNVIGLEKLHIFLINIYK